MDCHQRRAGVTLKPCVVCGEPSPQSRCPEHRPKDLRRNRGRGHANDDPRWRRLSTKLRKLSPFCELCGGRDDLTVDHIIPTSEAPELAHEPLNCRVLCRPCNSKRGNSVTDDERDSVHERIRARKARLARFYASDAETGAPRGAQGCGVAPSKARSTPSAKAEFALHTAAGRR